MADRAREDKRRQDATHLDPAADKWRYRPVQPGPKTDDAPWPAAGEGNDIRPGDGAAG